MSNRELADYLISEKIVSLEFEDTGGNTVLFVDLDNIDVADVEDYTGKITLRLQEVK